MVLRPDTGIPVIVYITETTEFSGVYCGKVNLLLGIVSFTESVNYLVGNRIEVGDVNILFCEHFVKVNHRTEVERNTCVYKSVFVNKIIYYAADTFITESEFKLNTVKFKTC